MKQITLLSLALLLAACQTTKAPELETPDDFIQTVTGSLSSFELIKEDKPDLVVRFGNNETDLTEKAKTVIAQWIENERPVLVAVQGIAGKMKHKDIGEARALSTMKYLLAQNVSVLNVPYEKTSRGLRAYMWSLESDKIVLANETLAAFIATP